MKVARCLVLMISLVCMASIARAQSFPAGPISLVVPLAPGDAADIAARAMAEEISRLLKTPVVPINRQGAGGAVGELGHCPVDSGIRCSCGRDGCLETVAAGWAIRAEASRLLGRPGLARANLAELEALRDPRVDEVLGRAAEALGAATAWLTNLLDPSIVILADTRFVHGAETFFAAVESSARRHAVGAELEIVLGTPDARLQGTIQQALELLPQILRPRRTVCA